MLDRLSNVVDEYETLERQLSDPEVLADSDQLRRLSKRYTELGPVVEAYRRQAARRADAEAARDMLAGASGDERDMLVAEIDAATADVAAIEDELRDLMLPTDPHDGKNVIMEIRGAEGGEEANLFARDLYEMYLSYAAAKGWKVTTLSSSVSDMGGFNDVTFEVRGETAWRNLKFEGGPHRVQRVPVTESQGRIHTSSATVTVLPEVDEVDVQIDDRDLDIDVYRAKRARRAEREHDRLRGADHTSAHRRGRGDAGRAVAVAEQGPGDARPAGTAVRTGGAAAERGTLRRATIAGGWRWPQRIPDLQLQGEPCDRPPHRLHGVPPGGDPGRRPAGGRRCPRRRRARP